MSLPGARPAALRVAAIQLSVVDGRAGTNLRNTLESASRAADEGAEYILLPELWTTGYAHGYWPTFADTEAEEVLGEIGAFCASRRVHVGGSMVERESGGGLVNRFRLIAPSGESVVRYDKVHLFASMLEDRHLVAGTSRVRAELSGWTASASICFDLRFPEMYRLDAVAGANLFLVVSAWPAARVEIMRGLAWARAVENQAFLVLCNRAGADAEGVMFGGGSMIVAPDGTILAQAGSAAGTIAACLDPAELELRNRLPVLGQRVAGVDSPVASAVPA